MNKKIIYQFTFLIILLITGSCSDEKNQSPNILFIMSDDHTSQAIGAYRSRLATLNPTPTIDKLAQEGMLFTHVFCNNSICTPSRATIMTGQYPQTHGVLDLDGKLSRDQHYLPQEMKKLGYSTAIIGKWHLTEEPNHFDYYKILPVQGKYFDPEFREKGKGIWPENLVEYSGHSTDIITNESISYLQNRDQSKPFFLMHHYKAPHDMFEYAPRYAEYLENDSIPEPPSLYEYGQFGSEGIRGKRDSLIHYIGTSVSERNVHRNYVQYYLKDSLTGSKATSLSYQNYLKDYLRCVKGIDDNLKKLFQFLKDEGLWENTIIIYTADQGMMLGEHDFQDKRWMYEESLRMPFIVQYPKRIKAGIVSDLLINNSDFAPTIIDLAGGEVPAYMQGASFKNTLYGGKEENWRKASYYRYWMHIIHHYVPGHFGIRTQDHKLIFYYGSFWRDSSEFKNFYWADQYEGINRNTPASWEFYDLKKDPFELVNEYENPEYKNRIDSMKWMLKDLRKELGETDKDFPHIQKIIDENWDK